MKESLDFSKIEDQKEFKKLPKEKQGELVGSAQEEAEQIKEKVHKIIFELSRGDIDDAIKIKDAFLIPDDVIQSREVQKIAEEVFIKRLSEGNISIAEKIKDAFSFPESLAQEATKEAILIRSDNGYSNLLVEMKNIAPSPEELISSPEVRSAITEILLDRFCERVNEALTLKEEFSISENFLQRTIKEDQDYLSYLYNTNKKDLVKLLGEIIPQEQEEENLTYIENIQNYLSNQEKEGVEELEGEDKYKNIFENLKGLKNTVWDMERENHEIARAFEEGAATFGHEKMFGFIGDYNRHDALFSFPAILMLQEKSDLSPEQFYGQILHQVRMDGSTSNDRDAYQRLNDVAQRFEGIDFQEVLSDALEYKNIASMGALLEQVTSVDGIFSNWKTLKKFDEIVDLLKKKELFEELKNIPEDKQGLKKYIETLIFHPNINTSAVTEFWQDPAEALGVRDAHSGESHELKKPSNYTDIPYLQLDAFDLRDALVEGDLDKIQTFESMEIIFKIPVDSEYNNLSISELTKKALGSFREKIQGEAQSPKKLFSEVQKILRENKIDLQEFLSGKVTLESNTEEQMRELLLNSGSGLKLKTREYRAKISKKSDPDAVVAGNDTACCMPFGSGKNNVYTYNPNCGQFVVQEKAGDGKWKTIAQSVLTIDIDIEKSIPEIVATASSGHRSMSDLTSDSVLDTQEEVVVCDNIEVAPSAGESRSNLEMIYRKFFREYLKTNTQSENLKKSEFLIGLGYNDLVFGESVKNTFLPIAPVGYSDNVGGETKKVSLFESAGAAIVKEVRNREQRTKAERNIGKGIKLLTFADTLKVSYIEGKAYEDNQSLMEYMHNMENGLIAKDIYNAKNDRPNMSFKYEDASGKMKGYMFAYEGKNDEEDVIYIADLAVLPDAKMAGGRLMAAFLQEYKKNYIDKGQAISIFAHARDKTSYKIIEKQLNKMGEKIGKKFVMEETGNYLSGDDQMREIIIRVR